MLKKADDIHELGALGPQLINENGIKQQSFWKEPTLTNTLLSISHLDFMNYNKNYKSEKFSSLKEVETLSGGAIFIKRSIFNEINAFNEDLFWIEKKNDNKSYRKIDDKRALNNVTQRIHEFPSTLVIYQKDW
mgnify:CR=1 FL=1